MTDNFNQRSNTPPQARDRDSVRKKALEHFTAKENRNSVIYQQMETERVASDAKTAKLRELRLAKEETDREAARLLVENPKPPKKKRANVIHTK
jgi:hypothetical protein